MSFFPNSLVPIQAESYSVQIAKVKEDKPTSWVENQGSSNIPETEDAA